MTGASQVVVKDLPANAGDARDMGLLLGLGRFPGEGNGTGAMKGMAIGRRPRRMWCHGGPGRKLEEREITTVRARRMKSESFP